MPKEPNERGALIECKCPRCGRVHNRTAWWFWWNGRGMPRVYCSACKAYLARFTEGLPVVKAFDGRRGDEEGVE